MTGIKRTITKKERLDIIKEHIILATTIENENIAIPKLRKHISWYLKGLHNNHLVKNKINECETKSEMLDILDDFLKNKIN